MEPGSRRSLQPGQAAARPLRPGDRRGADLEPDPRRLGRRRSQPGRLGAVRAAQRGGRPRRLRLAGRPTTRDAMASHCHLRGARQGAHPAAARSSGAAPRHVRGDRPRRDRGLPQGARGDRGRAAPGAPLRLRARPARQRAGQLLGLQHRGLLRPACGVQLLGHARRAGSRVQGDGPEPARRGARGHPGRGLQPHGRSRAHRSRALVPGPGRRRLLPRQQRGRLLRRHRVRQHGPGLGAPGAAARDGLAALLGHRDARGRLPLRPDPRAVPGGTPHGPARTLSARRAPRSRAPQRQAHRRAVGRVQRGLPRRAVPPAVVRVERPVPRCGSGLLAWPQRRGTRPGVEAVRIQRPVRR